MLPARYECVSNICSREKGFFLEYFNSVFYSFIHSVVKSNNEWQQLVLESLKVLICKKVDFIVVSMAIT